VSFVFKLDNLVRRVALIVVVSVICGALFWLIYSHFILRAVTDTRLSLAIEALNAASLRFPNSPRVHYRLAEAEMANAIENQQMVPSALAHAERAVGLSLWDYRARRLLGGLQELNGDGDGAEKSLRAAVQLAPYHTETNWALANLLLRRGKLKESLEIFRKAAGKGDELLPLSFDMLWQSSGGDLEMLKAMVGNDPSMQLSLVQFCLDRTMVTEAVDIFRGINRDAKLNSSKSATFIKSLLLAGQFETARTLWLDLVTPPTDSTSQSGGQSGGQLSVKQTDLIWNGGFEASSVKNFDHFDWAIAPSEYARFGIDTKTAHSGSRSIKISFAGRDTTKLLGEVRQLVVLKPGVRYHFECYARASDLLTPEGPRIAVIGEGGVIVSSQPVAEGTTDWQRLAIDFVAPLDSPLKYIGIVRVPKFSYDDPTRGVVWFDDFTLSEQSK
jgi:tetratricopeptide (TPR) repeat protein